MGTGGIGSSLRDGHPSWVLNTGSVLWLEEQGRLPEAADLAVESKGGIRIYQLEVAEGSPTWVQADWEVGAA